jgi:hypothetical protein
MGRKLELNRSTLDELRTEIGFQGSAWFHDR